METSYRLRLLALAAASTILSTTLFTDSVRAQGCDDCTKRTVAVYDIDVTVPKPSDPAAQADWLKLFEAGSGMYTTLLSDNPPDPCEISYHNLQFLVRDDGSVDSFPAGTDPLTNLAPAGSTHTGDYILSGRLDRSEALYILSLKLETAVSRKIVKTGLKGFAAENLASSSGGDLVTQSFGVILDMIIQNFEDDLRANNSDVAFKPQTIELRPAKSNLKADETVDVEIKLLDCDDEPLKDRSIKLRQETVKGVVLPGSVGGEFVEESVVTDENGVAHATFRPTIQQGEAVIRCHWVGVKPSGDTVWSQGQQMVGVELVPDFWKFSLTMNNSVTYSQDTSDEYSSYHAVSAGNGSVAITGFFRNEAEVDGVVQYFGGGDSIYWPTVSGSYTEVENSQAEDYAQGSVVYVVNREDNISTTAVLQGMLFEFSSDSVSPYFYAFAGVQGHDQYHIMTFYSGEWTPYDATADYGSSVSAGWDAGEPGGSIVRSGDGYAGTVTNNWTEYRPGPNGTAEVIYSRSMRVQVMPWYNNTTTAIKEHENGSSVKGFPTQMSLEQNYPNPFNPITTIKYTVGVAGGKWQVASGAGDERRGAGGAGAGSLELGARKTRLVVYDVLGRQVATLVDEVKTPGSYVVQFDGSGLASGLYICRMTAGAYTQSRKMILTK